MSSTPDPHYIHIWLRSTTSATIAAVEFARLHLEAVACHVLAIGASQLTAAAPPAATQTHDDYILVNPRAAGDALFVLPPGDGGAESYLGNLARRLRGVPLVLFNNIHLQQPMASFEALAEYYLRHVSRLQPGGSYSLLGWSFGGVLALEMAIQLARAGAELANLFFIDAFFDVPRACGALGLPADRVLLDPIHHRYQPRAEDLARLRDGATVVLWKATHNSDGVADRDRQRLFDYYARSQSNHLDTLIGASALTVETLGDANHFSWVRDDAVVRAIGARIRALMHKAR